MNETKSPESMTRREYLIYKFTKLIDAHFTEGNPINNECYDGDTKMKWDKHEADGGGDGDIEDVFDNFLMCYLAQNHYIAELYFMRIAGCFGFNENEVFKDIEIGMKTRGEEPGVDPFEVDARFLCDHPDTEV